MKVLVQESSCSTSKTTRSTRACAIGKVTKRKDVDLCPRQWENAVRGLWGGNINLLLYKLSHLVMQETIFRQAKYDASLSVYSSLYKAEQLPVGNLRPIGVFWWPGICHRLFSWTPDISVFEVLCGSPRQVMLIYRCIDMSLSANWAHTD